MQNEPNLKNMAVVLSRPRYPENIGAAARAMMNMGVGNLSVVSPENPDMEKILKMATHKAAHIVRGISWHDSLKEALAPFGYVAGTTARLGGRRKEVVFPRELAARLVSISERNQVALVFGPEDRGLSNEDIRLCHELVTIPTAGFSSLNLAQAVMVMCYEIRMADPDAKKRAGHAPALASVHELEGMYGHLKTALLQIGFINPENPDHWMENLRRFFHRLPLRSKETKMIRGVCRQIDWHGKKRYEDGRFERAESEKK
ncbi:tRNA (cytidine/uridine-2'-O-)-methyltransferase TrmJ [Candidatus Desulfarcum epimagneticum]|uniref:tRNA (cytidine/uridine-2'-O-)-methyltransferase TrmJ n=1 Tax=uncultured Desulfobacteraceae bacterium TaxID=218296 RepID=A0A484HGW5_9BACT|nr:tRNA (cytidine/uridine-2'-O-)-methyltransferase TrmJ [uncultured Desulfobacteraceae bacterium]